MAIMSMSCPAAWRTMPRKPARWIISACLWEAKFGLELDLEAADAVGLHRVEGLGRKLIAGMMDVFQTLSKQPVDMRVLMQQLRALSAMELQRTHQLMGLGHFAAEGLSVDGSRALAQNIGERVMSELRHVGQAATVHNAMRHMDLLKGLEGEFDRIASRLTDIVAQQDYKDGGTIIMKQCSHRTVTRHWI